MAETSHFIDLRSAEELSKKEGNHAELIYHSPHGKVVRKNILRTTTLIGSHDTCNMQLLSSDVEPAHALVTLDGRGFRIWDLRTRTGTYVNGSLVKSCRLGDGDKIRIGKFRFTMETNISHRAKEGFFIDEYRVLGILGTGGMGWLYAVEDDRTLQKFALKVLTRRAENKFIQQDELRTRFELEGKAGDLLRHPNIVELIDYQHRKDVEYLLMELFESINLQELVSSKKIIPYGYVCNYCRQIAMGLSHIHHQGLVHRDVKPANILVGKDGTTKICDFGLVFLGNNPEEMRLADQMGNDCLGTADYISPEQSIDSYKVDPRADVYSLGCSMYHALTGRVPFKNDSAIDKIKSHRKREAKLVHERNPDVPEEVSKIVATCMRKDPDERYQSAMELGDALAEHAEDRVDVEFDFEKILKKRTNHASFRLADPNRKHYLQRIPANVASSIQMISSDDLLGDDRLVVESPSSTAAGTSVPIDDTTAPDPTSTSGY